MTIAELPSTRRALTVAQRHRARWLAYANGGLWALGNGLVSGMLIVYLALDLGGPRIGLGVSFLLAAPQFVGLLRLGAPALQARLADRKQFCISAYRLSALVLLSLPLVASRWLSPSAGVSLAALVVLWCLYHLLEYVGTVALWSWLADLAHPRVRGRFLGYRERWMVTGQAVAMLAAGLFAWGWKSWALQWQLPGWIGYAVPAVLGAGCLLLALLPLQAMPRVPSRRSSAAMWNWRGLLVPFSDSHFLRLLAFGCWFSFFNGLGQTAQSIYPAKVLGLEFGFGLLVMNGLKIGTRGGQFLVSPAVGRWADRQGNRRVLLTTLPLVAAAPLFYWLATPQQPGWIAGAWILWIAYAGLNVALPNLTLNLAPAGSQASYIATYYGVTGLCLAVSTVVGGLLQDAYAGHAFTLFAGQVRLDYYAAIFLFAWLSRTAGLGLLWRLPEDKGISWRPKPQA